MMWGNPTALPISAYTGPARRAGWCTQCNHGSHHRCSGFHSRNHGVRHECECRACKAKRESQQQQAAAATKP